MSERDACANPGGKPLSAVSRRRGAVPGGYVVAAALVAALAWAGVARAATGASPVAWSADLGVPVYNTPRAGGGRTYLTSAQGKGANVFAINAANGKVIWKFAAGGAIPMPPSVGATQVFVASDIGATHYMRALDARTGTPVWEYTRDQPPQCMCSHQATVAAGLLFAQTDGHSLYAFAPVGNVPSRRLWAFQGDGAKLTHPVVADGVVAFGSADHRLYALDASTGAVRWVGRTGYGFVASPVVVGRLIVAGNRGGTVHAYDARTGKSAWSFSAGGTIATPAVARGGLIYVAAEDRSVYALDAKTGKQVWRARMADYAEFAPVPDGRNLLVANRAGELLALSPATGKVLWRRALGGTPFSAPLLWHGAVVLKVGDHAIASYDGASGHRLWRFRTAAVVTVPRPAGDVLVAGLSSGKVVGLR